MSPLNRISLAVLAVALAVIGARMLVIKIEPGRVGVVNKEWTSGFIEEDFAPGYHFDIGPFHNWTVFDTRVQTLHMLQRRDADDGDVIGPLAVKSQEGATVTMDISIKYRIRPGMAWAVMQDHGPGQTLQAGYKRKVQDRVEKVLRQSLGRIETEGFYHPEIRKSVHEGMESSLQQDLASLHVDLIAILVRDLRFQQSFEDVIKQQAIAEERQALNKAETEAADYLGRTQKIETETIAKVVVIDQEREKLLATMQAENDRKIEQLRADYQKAVAETKSDADLYAALKQAEGTKLLKEAEAKGQALRREALATDGGDMLVALELARNLRFGSLSLSTQLLNPLDVQTILDMLGAAK